MHQYLTSALLLLLACSPQPLKGAPQKEQELTHPCLCHPPAAQEVDFTDTDGVLASPGLLDFAISAGLWDPASGEPFNFFTALHAVTPKDPLFNYNRLCALQQLYGGVDNATCWAQVPYTPAFLPPAAPVGLRQVMAGLRDHYEGTPLDP